MSKIIAVAFLAQACIDDTSQEKEAKTGNKATYQLMAGGEGRNVRVFKKENEQSNFLAAIVKTLNIADSPLQENNGVWKSKPLKIQQTEIMLLDGDTRYRCQLTNSSAVNLTFTSDQCSADNSPVKYEGAGRVLANGWGIDTNYVLATAEDDDSAQQLFVFNMIFMATYRPAGTVEVRIRAVDDQLKPLDTPPNNCIDVFVSPPGHFNYGQSLGKENNTTTLVKGRKKITIDWDSNNNLITGFEYRAPSADGDSVTYRYKREEGSERSDPKLMSEDHSKNLRQGNYCNPASSN